MSQSKNVKHALRTEEATDTEFKTPPTDLSELHINGTDLKDELSTGTSDVPKGKVHTRSRPKTPLINSEKPKNTEDLKPNLPESPSHLHNTRSRSKTPQNKTPPQEIHKDLAKDLPETISEEPVTNDDLNASTVTIEELHCGETEGETDVCVAVDKDEEIILELEYDENDIDVESEGSPNRCKTRRSQAPSVSTPKTPKLIDDEEFLVVDLNEAVDHDTSDTHSSASVDNISTIAVAGSDITRNVDLTQDAGLVDEHTYTSPDRTLSFRETLKNISPRRTIRQINVENYRKLALVNTSAKHNDIPAAISNYDLVQRVSGVKRKSSSIPLNEPKKFKGSPGILSYITLPIYTLKNSFTATHEPKILSYGENDADNENKKIQVGVERKAERRWCSIM